MTIYTVLAPKVRDGDVLPDPMAAVFVKEGFSWPAFFFAGPWLIFRRIWLVLIGYLILAMIIGYVGERVGSSFPGAIIFLVHFLFALEANELRRWTLMRRGYRLVGVVEGRGLESAEIHYFTSIDAVPADAAAPPPPPPPAPRKLGPMQPSAEAGDVVGLFPAPGGAS
jgi:Protein of unknown function (DUF2628)